MDIKIQNSWLREYLKTSASPSEVAKALSLSGPSVGRVNKVNGEYVYDIEVTTNRVDCMSILGIAREASTILPNAKLKQQKNEKVKSTSNKNLLHISEACHLAIKIDPKLVNRVMAVVMEVKINKTPKGMKARLETAGMRSLNSIIDVTNYVMLETGHPTHVFDYDKIPNSELVFRPSDKGEKITSFDGKSYELPGGDIVIDDGEGEIIDLPGIIGTKNSVVGSDTKRIIFFIDNNDPDKIRYTSTRLGIRTNAAVLNEKGVDPELATVAFARGVELYKKLCSGKIISKIYDIYPNPYKVKTLKVGHEFIEKIIGIEIASKRVVEILSKLGFGVKIDKRKSEYVVKVPSWRARDISIPEDIVEEVARIYGYHNLPSVIMDGSLPEPVLDSPFKFERKVKNILKSYGGVEVYNLSLVGKENVNIKTALKLKNPLGADTSYLRTSLEPSLVQAVTENSGEKEPFYLFEMANVYISRTNDLPEERMMLGVMFSNYAYRKAKGVIEAVFEELNITDSDLELKVYDNASYIYFESEVGSLVKNAKDFAKYVPISKYPAQIEDVTLVLPAKTKVGEVMKALPKAELVDVFNDAYTFRIWYQDPDKTLTDEDVTDIRNRVLKEVKEKFGASVKD